MAGWVEPFTLPSEDKILSTESEIVTLEGELKEALDALQHAQLRVDTLTNALHKKRASIAPVRRANFDILSAVFEIAAKMDWRSPLYIGAVCRFWRAIVSSIPRVWSYVDMRRISSEGFDLYSTQSVNYGLHIRERLYTPNLEHFASIAHKIECLTIEIMDQTIDSTYRASPPLLNLKRLTIVEGSSWHAEMSVITKSHFPNLRNLEVCCIYFDEPSSIDLPPLDTFAVVLNDDWRWFHVIAACKNSLASLRITITYTFDLQNEDHICLPRLRYLKVVDQNTDGLFWPMHLETPVLETYIEHHHDGSCFESLHTDIDSVQYLRLQYLPLLGNLQQLQMLQLEVHSESIEVVLDKAENDDFLPHLRLLEFRQCHLLEEEVQKIEKRLSSFNSGNLLGTAQTIVENWSTDLPGEQAFKCGYKASCGGWRGPT